jgi:hypothetical protein
VDAELGRRHRIDVVAIPEMVEESPRDRLVVHAPTEAVKIGQGFGVALPGLIGVAPDYLLELGVLGHGQASS